ncbi:MAG: FKBP-type peptidyl-prolyl cis-trans isomerase [Bacteroidales bacterium]|nr:FKBP-type peptidyl-prolyl cis-trans isomerase [Bacteroidales bacterium]
MKKVTLLAAIVATVSFASCTAQSPKPELKTDIDSLSYSIGMAQTQGLKEYLVGRLEVDTTHMDEFIKGIMDGSKKTSKKEAAYMAGLQIGNQISNQMVKGINKELFGTDSTKTINKNDFLAGFISGTLNKGGKMTMQAAQAYVQTRMEAIKAKSMEKAYGANKKAGEDFLAANKTKPGVVTTPSGLQYKIETKGTGPMPTNTSKVKINYRGTTIDGKEFDSSFKRKEPATLVVGQNIKGFSEGLKLMPVGSKFIFYIPQNLAYGTQEAGQIKPFSTLIFEVELLSIEK